MTTHIIVEGPDGSGKTTFINQLMSSSPGTWRLHEKFSDSLAGPELGLLKHKVDTSIQNMHRWDKPTIMDRHPLVSEYVYGPICRHKLANGFDSVKWQKTMTDRLVDNTVLVVCHPPWHVVAHQLALGKHMPGVAENAYDIYIQYTRVLDSWPGVVLRYDRTVQSFEVMSRMLWKVST